MIDDQKVKKDEVTKLKKEVEEYKNKYYRALADYQNFEKRANEEKLNFEKAGEAKFILKLLPVIDHIGKAEVFIKDEGLRIVKESFFSFLKETGVEEIAILGKEFDPHLAEAIDMVPGEKDNIVVEVLRNGYKFQGKILRVAQVKVSKKVKN